MSIDQFTEATRRNFETFSAHPFYAQGVRALDVAYEAAIRSLPPDGHPAIYGRLLLVCHKHMVSAANLIASCLPEDSAGITRRAVEAAKVATATRLNDKNTEAWLSYEERNERWIRMVARPSTKLFHRTPSWPTTRPECATSCSRSVCSALSGLLLDNALLGQGSGDGA